MSENTPGKILVDHISLRSTILFLILKIFFADLLIIGIIVIFSLSLFNSKVSSDIKLIVASHNAIFFLILFTGRTLITIFLIWQWVSDYYEINNKIIIHKRGVILKKEEISSFDHIKLIGIDQSIFGKIINYGTIKLYDWYLSKYKNIYSIHNPLKYFHILENFVPKPNPM